VQREGDTTRAITFVPGYPDGSVGWAKVLKYLPQADTMPKLFVEYVGMGDSDKPLHYAYSTTERTDLVEALWRGFNVQSTTLVAFDFSSLVVLEHLQRRLERAARGETTDGPHIRGIFIFIQRWAVHGWAFPPLVHHAASVSSARLGHRDDGASVHKLQTDGELHVVKTLPGLGG
jgi:pimeloyl-ACP methyl ester carboxylesterase